ncbi:hypothetical protein BFP70_10595 [Thioclava sp. SK-1]|uniref:hypothetical protein n=1 Tax=Thioclava sp. SK-1 TaxID=1889770 RepID=UPI00082718C2|nr:hypothetical protein [Thioclava sp. SK-1]OCX64487.1 hypothetical protein BFP70_10595 [Thioclava sp. SK-1]
MITDFIAMLSAGVLAGLVMFAVRHAMRRWLGASVPKWITPAVAGVTMLGYTIYAEYTWYPTMRAALNDDVAVAIAVQDSNWWRPWTYAVPVTTRFMALDQGRITDSALPQTELLLVKRWAPVQAVPVAFDCAAHRRADLIGGAALRDGDLTGGSWVTVGVDDPALALACGGQEQTHG